MITVKPRKRFAGAVDELIKRHVSTPLETQTISPRDNLTDRRGDEPEIIAVRYGRTPACGSCGTAAATDSLELIMSRHERAAIFLTSSGRSTTEERRSTTLPPSPSLLGGVFPHAHVRAGGPRSWRTKVETAVRSG